jgi:hypothetical protein
MVYPCASLVSSLILHETHVTCPISHVTPITYILHFKIENKRPTADNTAIVSVSVSVSATDCVSATVSVSVSAIFKSRCMYACMDILIDCSHVENNCKYCKYCKYCK